jgi:predicted ferric reductase
MNKRLAWQILLWLNWLLIFWFWWQGSSGLVSAGWPSLTIAIGRLAGLSAAYMILLQFFFIGRSPWLERVFGLDTLSRLHHRNGRRGIIILIFHPILLILGYKSLAGVSLIAQTKSFLFGYEHVLWAAIGLGLFLIVAGTSIYIARNRLRYESWYFVHLLAYAAVFLSFFHQVDVGTDLITNKIFYGYWIALYIVVFTNHALFRFIRPIYNYFRHKFVVSRIVRENYNTVSVYLTGRDLHKFNIHPGQFMILRFFAPGLWWQAHPFSLSFVPDGKELRVTIKELGDFTKQVANIPPGTKLMIDGPYGVFTSLFSVSPKVLLIAGGIGITPIRSLIEQMAKQKKNVALLYANKAQQDIVFQKELDDIARVYGANVTHILSDDPEFNGERGYVDKEKITRLVPDLATREVYLCGPPPMMTALIKTLGELGVANSRVHYEKFVLG